MEDVAQTLTKLGLSDKEARIYFATLKLGQGSAQAIARMSGLKRPTAYVILEELRTKGLVLKMLGAKKQMFLAKSPEELVEQMQANLSSVERALPELMRSYKNGAGNVRTAHFEGIEGLKLLMEFGFEEAKGKELVGFYAIAPKNNKELNEYFKEWNEKRVRLDITMRGIAPEHQSLDEYRKDDASMKREFKTIPFEQFSSEVAIDATETVVRIHDYKNLQGVIIENREVAKTIKEIFEMVWSKKD